MSPKTCAPPGGSPVVPVERSAGERQRDFEEVVLGFSQQEATRAAARCLANVDCTFCDVCELLCPDQCVTRDPQTGNILIDLKHCKGCGLCAHYCPKGAIRMELEPTD